MYGFYTVSYVPKQLTILSNTSFRKKVSSIDFITKKLWINSFLMNEQCHSRIHYQKFTSTQVFYPGFGRRFQVSVSANNCQSRLNICFLTFYVWYICKTYKYFIWKLFTFSVVPAMCAGSHVKIKYLALIE